MTCKSNIHSTPAIYIGQNNSQVTIPARTLAIVPTTFTNLPKTEWYYNLTGTWVMADYKQNLFVIPLFKHSVLNYHQISLCTVNNISPDDITLPKNENIAEVAPIPDHDTIVHTASVN